MSNAARPDQQPYSLLVTYYSPASEDYMQPLEGVRICDFTVVWAGQSATMYLADLGADCIKVENPYVWNPMTRAASPIIDRMMAGMIPPWLGGHPGGDPGPRPWNNAPAFIHVLRNKTSFTVDSRRPEGRALVETL